MYFSDSPLFKSQTITPPSVPVHKKSLWKSKFVTSFPFVNWLQVPLTSVSSDAGVGRLANGFGVGVGVLVVVGEGISVDVSVGIDVPVRVTVGVGVAGNTCTVSHPLTNSIYSATIGKQIICCSNGWYLIISTPLPGRLMPHYALPNNQATSDQHSPNRVA